MKMFTTISCQIRLLIRANHRVTLQLAFFGRTPPSHDQKRALTDNDVMRLSCSIKVANFCPFVIIWVVLGDSCQIITPTISTENVKHLIVHDTCISINVFRKRIFRSTLPRPIGDAQQFGISTGATTDGKAKLFRGIQSNN